MRRRVAAAVQEARAAGAEGMVISFSMPIGIGTLSRSQAVVQRLAPGHSGVLLERDLADHPRIRAHHHGGDRRLCPAARRALSRLAAGALKDAGVPADPRLTKSNGGVMTAEQGKQQCVQMILSGTASGVIGASLCGRDVRHRALHEPRYRRHQRPTSR